MQVTFRLPFSGATWQTIRDVGERAGKTFAGGFLYGAGLLHAAADTVTGNVEVAASQINWIHGLDIGLGTTVFSLIFSLASLKLGSPGTASATTAVVLANAGAPVPTSGPSVNIEQMHVHNTGSDIKPPFVTPGEQ